MGKRGFGMGIRLSPAPEFDFEKPLIIILCLYIQKSGSDGRCRGPCRIDVERGTPARAATPARRPQPGSRSSQSL